MKIVLLAEAQRRFEAEDAWWRENRDAKDLFIDEFEQTLELLGASPERGKAYRVSRGKLIGLSSTGFSLVAADEKYRPIAIPIRRKYG